MYKEILSLLKCPKCNGELSLAIEKEENSEIVEGNLSCKDGHQWPIKEGVINFGSVEQEITNNWSEAFEKYDEEELRKRMSEANPKNLTLLVDKTGKFIIDNINNNENKFILDIATGTGGLFLKMVKQLEGEAQIICTDLSFAVLRYDRVKAKRINPEIKVNYIACDATNLPFKDNTIDAATSFFGIANMLNLAESGLKEAKRVLKTEGSFFDSYIIIKEESNGFKMLKDFCEENQVIGAEEFTIKTGVEKAYNEVGFHSTEMVEIGESIGEKNDNDLIPFEGEWFGVVVAKSIK